MKIHLNTSTLRAIYRLQQAGFDDNTIVESVRVIQKRNDAARALARAEDALTKHFNEVSISNDDKVNLEILGQ